MCFGASGSVRAINMPRLQICAVDVQTFWPVITHSSPSRSALHCSPARSEPAPGSLKSWHHASWPLRIRVSQRSFCSRGAVRDDRRAREQVAETGRRTDRAGLGQLLVHDVGQRPVVAAAEVVLGPGRRARSRSA